MRPGDRPGAKQPAADQATRPNTNDTARPPPASRPATRRRRRSGSDRAGDETPHAAARRRASARRPVRRREHSRSHGSRYTIGPSPTASTNAAWTATRSASARWRRPRSHRRRGADRDGRAALPPVGSWIECASPPGSRVGRARAPSWLTSPGRLTELNTVGRASVVVVGNEIEARRHRATAGSDEGYHGPF